MKTRLNNKNLLLWAAILPFQAGLVAMMSVLHFAFMSTNVAGHFPRVFRELLGQNVADGLGILFNITLYFLGALFTAYWVTRFSHNRRLMLMPYAMTLLILIIVTTASISDAFKLNLLFFAMANQNTFGAFSTEGVVKPSQLTGLLIDFAMNIVKWLTDKSPNLLIVKAQFVLILSFSAGLIVVILVDNGAAFSPFILAIIMQLVIMYLYFFTKDDIE